MGLDVGKRRVGIALSDPEGIVAYSRGTLQRTTLKRDLEYLSALVAEEQVELVVVGLPRSLDGTLGPQAQSVQKFGEALGRSVSVPIAYWDERLTTVAANRTLREVGMSGARRRQEVDAVAAALILQGYLDYLRNREKSLGGTSEEDGGD